jgi:hypothetical protein
MNIIPPLKTTSPDYFCTWETQYGLARRFFGKDAAEEALAFAGDQGARRARDVLNEEAFFGEPDLAGLFPEARSAMLLILDDGWDVGYGVHPSDNRQAFGSLFLNEARFPSCKGTHAERLRILNDKIKSCGWRGIGIWVCAQKTGAEGTLPFEPKEETRAYWKEKLLMSKEAGVLYWKVDWGRLAHCEAFRKMLTDMGKELYPELIIEHAFCGGPLNGDIPCGKLRFADDRKCADGALRFAAFSEVLRSYDVTPALSVPTTLDRLCHLLTAESGLINCEDELYIGAVLGCAVGVMRSHLTENKRLDEITAAIRWHSVAPAFSGGKLNLSEELKTDTFLFTPEDTWFSPAWNKSVSQSAPRVIARNAPLPKVEGENTPYILLSKNPNGVYSVGAISSGLKKETPPTVSFEADDPSYIGIFGAFEKLSISLSTKPKRAYIQSLIRGEAREIFPDNNRLIISGDLLQALHTSADGSQSAAAIKLIY